MTDELLDFSGKVALVTGGSRGLGPTDGVSVSTARCGRYYRLT